MTYTPIPAREARRKVTSGEYLDNNTFIADIAKRIDDAIERGELRIVLRGMHLQSGIRKYFCDLGYVYTPVLTTYDPMRYCTLSW